MAKMGKLLAAVALLAAYGCGSGGPSALPAAAPSESDGLSVEVGGESRDFDSASLTLCAEGLPTEIRFVAATTHATCPELSVQGPAGAALSRGQICEELRVQVRDFEIGVAVAARGSGAALVAYTRHQAPALVLSSGDSGAGNAAGSITVTGLDELPNGDYRLGLAVDLDGASQLSATGVITATPTFCMAA